ncbi:hypothetical protein [Aneurinibacillus tyrosinisolvens]|uniref:hypothetical protein n=1 Tax=Aneurinibacillus tyrosinisolvens TaxID=1443435 RepID=UPI00063F404B|nr:hypothetical protein [Aneurinibacillus tyrosinisolvens]
MIELQEKYREFYILLSSLRKTTPIWADLIEKSLGNEIAYPHEWEAAWKWNQLNTWVCELERYHPERIEVQIQERG